MVTSVSKIGSAGERWAWVVGVGDTGGGSWDVRVAPRRGTRPGPVVDAFSTIDSFGAGTPPGSQAGTRVPCALVRPIPPILFVEKRVGFLTFKGPGQHVVCMPLGLHSGGPGFNDASDLPSAG